MKTKPMITAKAREAALIIGVCLVGLLLITLIAALVAIVALVT